MKVQKLNRVENMVTKGKQEGNDGLETKIEAQQCSIAISWEKLYEKCYEVLSNEDLITS